MTIEAPSPLDSLTGALVEANDQLLALYELATITSQSLDEREAVDEILTRAINLLGADGLQLTVADDDPSTPDTEFVAGSALVSSDGVEIAPPPKAPTETAVSVETTGYAGTLRACRLDRSFGTADHKLLSAVATMALGAVRTSRHHHDALNRAMMARDHDTASELAQQSLPSWRPSLDGVRLFARSDPARAAGGDLFTFAAQDGALHFVLGDVSGKGLPAAMMMTTVISAATAAFQTCGDAGPAAMLSSIDNWVHDYLADAGLFVTLMAGTYGPDPHHLSVASAGHGPMLFVEGDQVSTLDASVPPIGVLPLSLVGPPTDIVLDAKPGSRLVVSSDGFTEQANPQDEMWGDDRLIEAIRDRTMSTDELGDALFEQLETYADGAEQTDDRTLLILDVMDR